MLFGSYWYCILFPQLLRVNLTYFILLVQLAQSVTSFTEDFDFEAMNEKFKKEEVWGHLGKSKVIADDVLVSHDEDEDDVQIDSKVRYLVLILHCFTLCQFILSDPGVTHI